MFFHFFSSAKLPPGSVFRDRHSHGGDPRAIGASVAGSGVWKLGVFGFVLMYFIRALFEDYIFNSWVFKLKGLSIVFTRWSTEGQTDATAVNHKVLGFCSNLLMSLENLVPQTSEVIVAATPLGRFSLRSVQVDQHLGDFCAHKQSGMIKWGHHKWCHCMEKRRTSRQKHWKTMS